MPSRKSANTLTTKSHPCTDENHGLNIRNIDFPNTGNCGDQQIQKLQYREIKRSGQTDLDREKSLHLLRGRNRSPRSAVSLNSQTGCFAWGICSPTDPANVGRVGLCWVSGHILADALSQRDVFATVLERHGVGKRAFHLGQRAKMDYKILQKDSSTCPLGLLGSFGPKFLT